MSPTKSTAAVAAPAPPAPAANTSGPLQIECDLHFIDGFLQPKAPKNARNRRPILPAWPVRQPVSIGDWGLVTSGRGLLDRDTLQEVYHEGDMVIVDEYDLDGSLEIIQLRIYPGTIRASFSPVLAGLSIDADDAASMRSAFNLELADPKKFYSTIGTMLPDPRVSDANLILKDRFCEMITGKLNEAFAANIDLWSDPDVRVVSGRIATDLEHLLEYYGLQVSVAFMTRKLPKGFPALVVEYGLAERAFLAAIPAGQLASNPLGLSQPQVTDLRNTSQRRGQGAGLFEVSKNPQLIGACISWLESLEPRAAAAIGFLRLIEDGKLDLLDLEITQKIVLSAFRNPMLAIGEWANPEQDVESAELFQQTSRIIASGAAAQPSVGTSAGATP